jgi:hypothetical protein
MPHIANHRGEKTGDLMSGRVRFQNLTPPLSESGQDVRVDDLVRDYYRLDSRQRRVLVIGSAQKRSVPTVGWLDPWPNLADFDVIILNLQSLDRINLVKLSRVEKERLLNMRGQLFELMLSGGEVYCILAPFLAFGSYLYFPDGSMEPEWSNFKWSPIGFSLTEIRGETLRIEDDVKFDDYLRQVGGWDGYLNTTANVNYLEERLRQENKLAADEEVFWQSFPLALNRYGKPLAASLCFGVRQRESEHHEPKIRLVSDYLHLLPPPTKISLEKGIDALVEEAKGLPAKSLAPEWSEAYRVPGEDGIEQKMNDTTRRIKSLEREQKRFFQAYRDIKRCKALLYEHGENLRQVIADVLHRLEFKVTPFKSAPELLVLTTRYGRLLLDAAGRSGPAQLGDLQLLLRNAIFSQEEDGRIWKGILVFNHYRLLDPLPERPAAFSNEVVTRAREMRLGLMTAEGLYAAFCSVLRGSMLREELEDRVYHSTGIISLPIPEYTPQTPPPRLAPRLEIE